MSKNHLCQVLLFRLSGVLPVSFLFQRMECRFYDMECKFRPMERMFQPLEWSTCRAKTTRYSSGIRAVCRSKARCA